jgi:hypothetical protein
VTYTLILLLWNSWQGGATSMLVPGFKTVAECEGAGRALFSQVRTQDQDNRTKFAWRCVALDKKLPQPLPPVESDQ